MGKVKGSSSLHISAPLWPGASKLAALARFAHTLARAQEGTSS